MTGAFAVCITLFLTFSTLVDFMKNAFVPPIYTPECNCNNLWSVVDSQGYIVANLHINISCLYKQYLIFFSDSLSQIQQQRNLYHTFAILVYGFLSIIVAITIFHIMNTISMGFCNYHLYKLAVTHSNRPHCSVFFHFMCKLATIYP